MQTLFTCFRWAGGALLLLALGGCASFPDSHGSKKQYEIKKRLDQVFAAAENKDFTRLDSYHRYGSNFTKFSGSSAERLDAAAARKGEHAGLGAAKNLHMHAESLKIDVFGNVGIATFILDYSFAAGDQIVHRKDRSTLVFVKDDREWKIAHEHLSPSSP